MLRKPRTLNSFSGLAWNQKAIVQLPGGPTYHELVIDTNDGAGGYLKPADILRAQVRVNGDTTIDITGAQLRMFAKYRNLFSANGIYVIPFGDLSASELAGQAMGALVTFPTDNLSLEITLGAKGSSTAVPTLNGTAWVSASLPQRSIIRRIRTVNFDASATGRNSITTLPRGPKIQNAHFQTSNIDFLRIIRDNLVVYEQSQTENKFMLQRNDRKPQSGWFHFDPVASGFNEKDLFDTVSNSLEFQLDVTGTGNISCLLNTIEQVGALPNSAGGAGGAGGGANPQHLS